MATTTRRRISRSFWSAVARSADRPLPPSEPIVIRPRGWTASVEYARATHAARVIELTDRGVRLLIPAAILPGADLLLRIANPDLGDALYASAVVTSASPPPPVSDAWIIDAEFRDLAHEEVLRISRWWMKTK